MRASHSHLGSACFRREAYAGQHQAMWRRVGATSLPQSGHPGIVVDSSLPWCRTASATKPP
eukprot:3094730-Alexandrium_andersonii.AAC.1